MPYCLRFFVTGKAAPTLAEIAAALRQSDPLYALRPTVREGRVQDYEPDCVGEHAPQSEAQPGKAFRVKGSSPWAGSIVWTSGASAEELAGDLGIEISDLEQTALEPPERWDCPRREIGEAAELLYAESPYGTLDVALPSDEEFRSVRRRFQERLETVPRGPSRNLVERVLGETQAIVRLKVQFQDQDNTFARLAPLWAFLAKQHGGLLHIEGEGYFDGATRILPDPPLFEGATSPGPGRLPLLSHAIDLALVGRMQEADAAFRQLLLLRPDDVAVHENYAVFLEQQGRIPEALEHAENVLRHVPSHEHCTVIAARAMAKLGNPERADERLCRALSGDPESAFLLECRASLLDDMGRWEEAEALFRQALAANPTSPAVLVNLAFFLYRRRDDLPQALALTEQALSLYPTLSPALANRALFLALSGRDREARTEYRRAVATRQPDDGLDVALVDDLQQAIAAHPEDGNLRALLEYVQGLLRHRQAE